MALCGTPEVFVPAALALLVAGLEDLFAAWKDADTDIPMLQQARAEYAQLR